jgi:predicted  nucleic acid-binding Zn-ribbon protein
MSHEASSGWLGRRVRRAMQGEIDTLRAHIAALAGSVDAGRGEIAELQGTIQAMANRMADAEAGLAALREAMHGAEGVEALRLRVEGLLAQHRWDSDQLRQALAAIAERMPLGD